MLLSSILIAAQLAHAAPVRQPVAQPRVILPTLAFPEPGLDDPAAYQGYQTRLFKDAVDLGLFDRLGTFDDLA